MKRDKKIEIRMTAEERDQIEKKASENGESMSSYVLGQSLKYQGSTDAKLRKQVATMLCRLNLVVETLDSVQARNAIKELEEGVWHCLK